MSSSSNCPIIYCVGNIAHHKLLFDALEQHAKNNGARLLINESFAEVEARANVASTEFFIDDLEALEGPMIAPARPQKQRRGKGEKARARAERRRHFQR